VEDAEIALQAAYDSLYAAQESNNRTAATLGVELQSIAEEIALQQEKVKSLAGDESNYITADVPGTVSTVECTAGDTVLKNALLATLEVPDMGYTLSFAVTNDQAQRLRIGDTATISNYYWGNSVTATLSTIRTDPKNQQGGKILVFDLTGDVTAGSDLTISVGQKSANYDLIVPNSAVKSDSNGSFVLAVGVKSSPLGNRYTARRVSVEVLASDDSNSAVVADLSNGDYVITTGSAPVKSGDLVRLADNG
jgi:multidrug efflux pump subunit AcrA (membrane-fusion protein)